MEDNNLIKVVNITWDTDGISIDDLPEEVIIEEELSDGEIADYLSDIYGWCVKNFSSFYIN